MALRGSAGVRTESAFVFSLLIITDALWRAARVGCWRTANHRIVVLVVLVIVVVVVFDCYCCCVSSANSIA